MRTRREIKAELSAELSLEHPDLERVAALTAELEQAPRFRRRRQRDAVDQPVDPEAIATWPPELRARLSRSAASRVIDGSTLDDPDGWGALNDLRRRGARP